MFCCSLLQTLVAPSPFIMEAWATLPLAARPARRESAKNPNWTLSRDELNTKRASNMGLEVEQQRSRIEGTRCALRQFAARNQRIVADPFPNQNSFPRKDCPRAATPQSTITSSRETYNPSLQKYEIRNVKGPSAEERGFASNSCCFAVDSSNGSSQWRSTNLNVSDITAKETKRPPTRGAAQPRQVAPEWWGS
jgi:hypothetical protein